MRVLVAVVFALVAEAFAVALDVAIVVLIRGPSVDG